MNQKSELSWFEKIASAVLDGLGWIFKHTPITSFFVLSAGFVFALMDKILINSTWFIWLSLLMIVDGTFARKSAEREKERQAEEYRRWQEWQETEED